MPELPEVETVRTVLSPFVVGQTIAKVTINLPKVVANLQPATFVQKMTEQNIINFTRRGKFLTLHLQSGAFVVLHLRMTGTLTVEDADVPIEKHTNLILTFQNGKELRFVDSRGFGRWWYFAPGQTDTSGQNLLGPEPSAVTIKDLQRKIATRKTALKTLLLDQHLIAGIGNIYADEILFLSKINPNTKGKDLSKKDFDNIIVNTRKILEEAIKCGGTTIRSYTSSLGVTGHFQGNLLVHNKEGMECQTCGTIILKCKVNGRGTYYCPKCQGDKICI
jgi:formamidopyrimidine-DNA glycosylase